MASGVRAASGAPWHMASWRVIREIYDKLSGHTSLRYHAEL
jgi:hypothetical protein